MPNKIDQTDHLNKDDRRDVDPSVLDKQKRRYEKVRHLCKNLNRKRRILRDKVDLLCKDLVTSNKQLAHSLGDLRRLCDFQHEMIGENDLAYLMHKALQLLILDLPETSAAMFLSATRKFEAHLSGSWQRQEVDLESVESILTEAVIDVHRKKTPVVQNPGDVRDHDYSFVIMGLPVMAEGECVGVVVFYRAPNESFSSQEQVRLQSCLPSLGRQIVAVQRLHAFFSREKS